MSKTNPTDITKKRIVYFVPEMDTVTIHKDVEYQHRDGETLAMDIYYPPGPKTGKRTPAVVFVIGYSDAGFQKMLGCKQKEMLSYVSWGQATSASGLIAITYSATKPAEDLDALVRYVRQNAGSLGIDENRIAIWTCSGNAPNALSFLMQLDLSYLKCAVLCYPMVLDLEGYASTAESAKMFGFSNPSQGKSVEDLPRELPLFIARAGRDAMPHLNETLDRFVTKALNCNLAITLTNHATAPHAFDTADDSETSREIIRQILAFMRFHLRT
jgi:acetyl esterase/lipase